MLDLYRVFNGATVRVVTSFWLSFLPHTPVIYRIICHEMYVTVENGLVFRIEGICSVENMGAMGIR